MPTRWRSGGLRTVGERLADDLAKCRCGNPSDGWPDELGVTTLCQDCWESDCDESWWANFAANPMFVIDVEAQ